MKTYSSAELSFIFYQLGTMIQAGIPLIQAWRLLFHDMGDVKKYRRIEGAAKLMEGGLSPSEAMGRTGLFPALACHVIRAGEHSGAMETMLRLLGDYYEKNARQRRKFIQAISYPIFLLACSGLLCIGSVVFILPVFEEMFQQMAVPLPRATQLILSAVQWLQQYGLLLAAAAVGSTAALGLALRNQDVCVRLEQYILRISWIRKICITVCWEKFSRILAVQIGSGIPILQALDDSAAAVPSLWFRNQVRQTRRRLEKGVSFSRAVKLGRFGTLYIETMLTVGEATGRYEDALQHIASYYEWQIAGEMAKIQRFLGPVVLLLVGICTGSVIVCLLLPVLDMATGIVM